MPKLAAGSAELGRNRLYAALRDAASVAWSAEKIQIDVDARVSPSEGGAWVQAWVWVDGNLIETC
jgi:hypothetical protein